MRNAIRNEASFVLVVAVIFSAIAIPVLSGFLEPSQPPAVAAVQIGVPRDGRDDNARNDSATPTRQTKRTEKMPTGDGQRQRSSRSPARRRPAQSAPPALADDALEDDGGEVD